MDTLLKHLLKIILNLFALLQIISCQNDVLKKLPSLFSGQSHTTIKIT